MFLLPNVTVAERSCPVLKDQVGNLILRTFLQETPPVQTIKLSICCLLLFNDTFNGIFSFHFTALEAVWFNIPIQFDYYSILLNVACV